MRFNTTNKEEIEVARSIVLQNETGGSISTNEDALAVAENYLREGIVTEYRAEDHSTYAGKNRGRKGTNSKQASGRGESWFVGRDGVEETTLFSLNNTAKILYRSTNYRTKTIFITIAILQRNRNKEVSTYMDASLD